PDDLRHAMHFPRPVETTVGAEGRREIRHAVVRDVFQQRPIAMQQPDVVPAMLDPHGDDGVTAGTESRMRPLDSTLSRNQDSDGSKPGDWATWRLWRLQFDQLIAARDRAHGDD